MYARLPGPPTVIAEIGINHNGSLDTALDMIESAKECGADMVKFQMRTPILCVPEAQRSVQKDTPWGTMTYLEYKKRMEFSIEQYQTINEYARQTGIKWFASVWDIESAKRALQYFPDMPLIKIPSALCKDETLIKYVGEHFPRVMMSVGMTTKEEMISAIETLLFYTDYPIIMHTVSAYPCQVAELHLENINLLKERYTGNEIVIGYSGHETGLAPSLAAHVLGAAYIERHFTLDRGMWGTDQGASLEPEGLRRLVRDLQVINRAMGIPRGARPYPPELASIAKLRGA